MSAALTQTDAILGHLRSGRALTPMDALRLFGCMRLAARVRELREAGHRVETSIVEGDGKRFALYWMPTSH